MRGATGPHKAIYEHISMINSTWKQILLFILILCLGMFFRFYNLNWDNNMHLQPDERFLILVSQRMQIPSSFSSYLSPDISPFNPFHLGFSFYVYGIFPLTVNKLLSLGTQFSSYNLLTLQGRFLSALADSLTLVVIFLLAKTLGKQEKLSLLFPFLASFFYAISVLPIQLSHFFTVDMFATFFIVVSTYFVFLFYQTQKKLFLFLGSTALGLALACKINVGLVVPIIVYFFVAWKDHKRTVVIEKLFLLVLFFVLSYLALRIADPYLFATSSFFNPQISNMFLSSIATLYFQYSPLTNYPPAFQWLNKTPVVFSLVNIFFFGLGPVLSLFLIGGGISIMKKHTVPFFPLFLWLVLAVGLESLQFAQTMRYFVFFYPFFAIFAAYGYVACIMKRSFIIRFVVCLLLFIWPLSFFSIYLHPNPRITASEWMYQHLPQQSILLSEYWDDALPLPVSSNQKSYTILPLPVFSDDTPQKWQTIQQMLSQGDYLVLSSPRAWNTIQHLPQRYPRMSKWYQELFAGHLSYKKIAEFTSYPSLAYLGIPVSLNDTTIAEEAFSVFDHPYVVIFKNTH